MRREEVVFRSLLTNRRLMLLNIMFLTLIIAVSIITGSFFLSLVQYQTNNEKYNISMRTLMIAKNSNHGGLCKINEEDFNYINSLQEISSVFPEDHRSFYSPIEIKASNSSILDTSIIGIDVNSLPNGFMFKDYCYQDFERQGVLLPEEMIDQEGKRIICERLIGKTIRINIVQYDYMVDDATDDLPVLGEKQLEFTVMGIYDTSTNYGEDNQVFMSSDNVGMLSDLFWSGYLDENNAYYLSAIVKDYSCIDIVIDKLRMKNYDAQLISSIDSNTVKVLKTVSGSLCLVEFLVLALGILTLQKNKITKARRNIVILKAIGFSESTIKTHHLILSETGGLYCFIFSIIVYKSVRRDISTYVFGSAKGMKDYPGLYLMIVGMVVFIIATIDWQMLHVLLSESMSIEDE